MAQLELTTPLSLRECRELELDPWNCSEGIRPHRMLNAVRRSAYRGRGRERD